MVIISLLLSLAVLIICFCCYLCNQLKVCVCSLVGAVSILKTFPLFPGKNKVPPAQINRPVGRTNPTRPVQLFTKDNHGVKILLIAKY